MTLDHRGKMQRIWMRTDGREKRSLTFDNMKNRAIKGTGDWTKYQVVLDVPQEAEAIHFGGILSGKGRLWVDDISLDIVGADVASTDQKIASGPIQYPARPNWPKEPTNANFEN
jgi:serine/threonine-protein kinase